MDKRCEHFLFRKLSGLPTPATILTCVIQTQPALKKKNGIEKVSNDAMSVDRPHRPRSLRPPVRTKVSLGTDQVVYASMQQPNLRAKLKSPKLSSWEDCSPSRSTANNQKCSESSSRSLSPCPLSYSNPCITSVYASHLFGILFIFHSHEYAAQNHAAQYIQYTKST